MKRVSLIFPLMFLVALAGSAFTQLKSSSTSKKATLTYYYDDNWAMCDGTAIVDGNCISDPVGYVCKEFVDSYGWAIMYQYGVPTGCFQPFYSYYPNNPADPN
jgi:hypothetical protein